MDKTLILVVEDDIPVQNLITVTLKAEGYRYLTAQTGQAAVISAATHNPDIILLDLGLPDLDGVEVIRRVRSSRQNRRAGRRGRRLSDKTLFRCGASGTTAGHTAAAQRSLARFRILRFS